MPVTLAFKDRMVYLPSPDYGDSLTIKYRKIMNRTRGTELIMSPKMGYGWLDQIQTVNYSFSFINPIVREELLQFLLWSIGQTITVEDYNGDIFTGIITNPNADVINVGRNNNTFSIEIEVIQPIDTKVRTTWIVTQGLGGDYLISQGYGEPKT